ncbi:TonB-dependent receptor [Asticcacaulis sp. SL142]|uniref:TonB-dependent receptor n=1 Tax=Asticcacaulis sp. SL142 TaxID=2995155 RepID=UPI00226C731D|nr:TonB-dependent receptor [Asticcacaulis sp. SL142]WAC49174.1 TonB-dependent receptor [Asticcacaulis sp. SL142]
MSSGAFGALWFRLALLMPLAGVVCPHIAVAESREASDTLFDVPEQSLDTALRLLAQQGRVQILFSGDRVAGQRSRAVKGRLPVRQAFGQALTGTGLEVRRVTKHTLIVVASKRAARKPTPPRPERAQPEREVAVPVVVVVAPRTRIVNAPAGRSFDAEVFDMTAVKRLSRADLAQDSAQNLSEALSGLPGMTVVNTGRSFIGGVDSASRGEGLYAAFRGLNAEYNLNMINGVTLAQGQPYSRGIQLSLLPPAAFQNVVVYKTGRADLDGDFVGAAMDFQTPQATDIDGKPWTALTVTGRAESRARDYGDDGLGGGIRLEHAHRLGPNQQIGLYIAAEYERRTFVNSELAGVMAAQNDNGWAYSQSGSASGDPVDPTRPQGNLTLTSLNVGVSSGHSLIRNQTASLDWKVSDTLDVYLYGNHAEAETEQNSTFSQVVSGPHRWVDDGSGTYRLVVDSLSSRVWYETNPDEISLSTLTLGAHATAGTWRLSPYLFASDGNSARPDHIEASAWVDQTDGYNQGNAPRAFGGSAVVTYVDHLPVPQWPQSVFEDLDQAGQRLRARRAGQLTAQFSGQTRYGAGFDAAYSPPAGLWQSLKFGVKYSLSDREVTHRNWTNRFFGDVYETAGLTWEGLGIARGAYDSVFPGLYDWSVPRIDHDQLMRYFYQNRTELSFDTCGQIYINNLNCNTQSGTENVAAAYGMGTLIAGPWELLAGLRYEHTRIANTYWVMPDLSGVEQAGSWARSHSQYSKLLPSLNLNYRPDTESVWRAALWRSYVRPAFMQLGGGVRQETVAGITTLTRGNPDLKSVDATNLDLNYQRVAADGSALSLSAYYKRLDHYLFENGGSLDGVEIPATDTLRIVMPQNGGRGEVYGLEAEFFRSLPNPLGLIGEVSLHVNLSRQWSQVDLGRDDLGRDMPMQNAPDWLGNVDLTYRRGRTALYLSYNYIGAYLSDYDVLQAPGTWDNLWVRPVGRLDARAQFQLRRGLSLDLVMTNLTDDYSYWSHVGRDSLALSDVIDSGRRFVISVRREF